MSSSSNASSEENEYIDYTGKILNKNYIILKKIGCGAFSTVWLSYNLTKKNFNAIKIQNSNDYDEGLEEVEYLKKIKNNKYLNTLIDSFIYTNNDLKNICMVFELLYGSIYDLLKEQHPNGFPIDVVIKITYQLLYAVDTLHSKLDIIHTDLKPENMLFVGVNGKTQKFINKFKKTEIDKINKMTKFKKNNHFNELIYKMVFQMKFNNDSDDSEINSESSNNSESDNSYKISRSAIESESDLETDSDSEISNFNKGITEKISTINLNNIQIKLSDFGLCINKNNATSFSIQTRHYRAPEIILKHEYNEKCDMWSIGCILYELLTGKVLFLPIKSTRFNRDRHHIYDIIKCLGKIPDEFVNKCSNKALFFCNNGLLKSVNKINYETIVDLIQYNLKNKEISEDKIYLFSDLLLKLFEYDIDKRFSTKQALNHELFNDM
jgi:serine/threonine-protein kinase SRPK3